MHVRFPTPRRLAALVLLLALLAAAPCPAVWTTETVDKDAVGKFSSIAVEAAGKVHVSYYDARNGEVKHAVFTGSAWKTEVAAAGVGAASLFTPS
jgi:hypothetical protein